MRAFPIMSVGHERGSETDDTQRVARFAARSVSPLHHRLRDFRHGNVDASDGARLGHDFADDFRFHARIGEPLRGIADARADDGRRFSRRSFRQEEDSSRDAIRPDRNRAFDWTFDLER